MLVERLACDMATNSARFSEAMLGTAEAFIARIMAATGEQQDTPSIFLNNRSAVHRKDEVCFITWDHNFEHSLWWRSFTLFFISYIFSILGISKNVFLPNACPFLYFLTSLQNQESVSDHALLCDYLYTRCINLSWHFATAAWKTHFKIFIL